MKWQKLKHTPHYGNVYRTPVPGGWLVLADTWAKTPQGDYMSTGVGITFYPDPAHEWTIEEDDADTKE